MTLVCLSDMHFAYWLQGKGRGFDLWKATCWARTYWHRLVGTALSWLIWDFAFYGACLYGSCRACMLHTPTDAICCL